MDTDKYKGFCCSRCFERNARALSTTMLLSNFVTRARPCNPRRAETGISGTAANVYMNVHPPGFVRSLPIQETRHEFFNGLAGGPPGPCRVKNDNLAFQRKAQKEAGLAKGLLCKFLIFSAGPTTACGNMNIDRLVPLVCLPQLSAIKAFKLPSIRSYSQQATVRIEHLILTLHIAALS